MESNLVQPEQGSVCEGCSAEWLIYTELIGNTMATCSIRTCSAVDGKWLKPYFPRLQDVDLKRLTGGWEPTKKKVDVGILPGTQEQREVKADTAKERYLARKAAEAAAKKKGKK